MMLLTLLLPVARSHTWCRFLTVLLSLLSPSRCGSERESITTILRAPCGRRCLPLGRCSRSVVAPGIWSGQCCGKGSSLSGRASPETAPKVRRDAGGGGFSLCVIVSIKDNIVCMSGTSWVEVESPSPDVGATHVAVGINTVWALTKDNKVRTFYNEHFKRPKS